MWKHAVAAQDYQQRKVALKPVSSGSRKWNKILSKILPSAFVVSVYIESNGGASFSVYGTK